MKAGGIRSKISCDILFGQNKTTRQCHFEGFFFVFQLKVQLLTWYPVSHHPKEHTYWILIFVAFTMLFQVWNRKYTALSLEKNQMAMKWDSWNLIWVKYFIYFVSGFFFFLWRSKLLQFWLSGTYYSREAAIHSIEAKNVAACTCLIWSHPALEQAERWARLSGYDLMDFSGTWTFSPFWPQHQSPEEVKFVLVSGLCIPGRLGKHLSPLCTK